jgi:uncharacterized membrane protein YgcG
MRWVSAGGPIGLILAVSAVAAAAAAQADERILSYHSDIEIHQNATMTVTETIRVRAEGVNIRRGIYRDFPTRYEDAFGNDYVVEFQVVSVTRDGASEPWFTEDHSNGMRVYIGDANRMLPSGEHTYALTYRTDRQIGYFEEHDELYWNVTGTDWLFPIDAASAKVSLPAAVPADRLAVEGYTGPFGASGRDYRGEVEVGGAYIAATRRLSPREGLTVVVSWPKGIVFEPTTADRLGYLLEDNLGLLLALAALLAVLGYLYWAWWRYGRDPEAGVTFAHYEPPEGYSPGSARYISQMGYDSKTFGAAVVALAVKGYLTIEKVGRTYFLRRAESNEPLGPGEAVLNRRLFEDGPRVELDDENHELIGGARRAHRRALRRHYYQTYFVNNSQWLVPSFLGSLLVLGLIAAEGWFSPAVLMLFVVNAGVQGLFLYLMKSPTKRGRALMDKLAGFELYLSVAEKDDLNIAHPPELTPALFERYLPFAIALGVENEWAEQFASALSRLEMAKRQTYSPRWYQGDFNPHALDHFVDDVGASFSSAIASAATPPGSSSGGGGGGFSGGGGGGGGGGGW